MPTYVAPYTFDFEASIIDVDVGASDVDCQELYSACKTAQASEEGILYERIAAGSGLRDLGPGVQVGLTVELLGDWQVRFPSGNYIARVAGGNLVGGPDGDPVAYTAGVQVLLIQSAASTVVTIDGSGGTGGGGLTTSQAEQLRELWRLAGLDSSRPLVVGVQTRTAGPEISQTVEEAGGVVTVRRGS